MPDPFDSIPATDDELDTVPAPAALRSRIYSALIREVEKSIPLRPLSETEAAGFAICDWEKVTRHLPGGETRNHCTLCHARVVAETFDGLSMPWNGCPYHKLHSK